MMEISDLELPFISQEEEVFFLYLYPTSTSSNEIALVQSASRPLLGTAPIYKSSSSSMFAKFQFPAASPYILVFKDHEAQYPVSSYNITSQATSTTTDLNEDRQISQNSITQWLQTNKFATLTELTGNNFKDYMEDGQQRQESYVVLTALSKKRLGEAGFASRKSEMEKIAKAWRQALKFTPKDKPTHFVWVDTDLWGKYLSVTYGIDTSSPDPPMIVTDPSRHQFYTKDDNHSPLGVDGRQIFGALESLYAGKLKPQTSISFSERVLRWSVSKVGWIFVSCDESTFSTKSMSWLKYINNIDCDGQSSYFIYNPRYRHVHRHIQCTGVSFGPQRSWIASRAPTQVCSIRK